MPRDPDVAIEHDRLRLARYSGKPEAGCGLALIHDAAAGEVRIFQVVYDQCVEVARVGEGVPHHLRALQRAATLGEGDRAGFLQQAELGELLAGEPARHRCHRVDADDGRVARAAEDEIDQRRIVDHRIGVGHRHDAR